MNILFCINTMTKGGAERVIANLSNYMSKDNNVYIVTLNNTDVMYKIDKKVIIEHLDEEKMDIYNKKSIFNKINRQIYRLKKYKNIVKKYNINIIVAFLPVPSFISLVIGRIANKKVIISVRNDPQVEYKSMLYKFLMKRLYKKADKIVFQTNDAMNYFSEDIRKKGIIIPNPLNPIFLNSYYEGKRKKTIVSVGRLEEQKNQLMLIRAFSKISKEFNEYNLKIYGEGTLRSKLQNEIDRLELNEKVKLCGISNNIKEDIKDASLFIITSNYEGMPNALMEAMALGLPVISTDCPCGGPKFLIENKKNGILIPVGDEKVLIESIRMILNNNKFAIQIGKNALEIGEKLSPNIINQKWNDLIREVYINDKEKDKENC